MFTRFCYKSAAIFLFVLFTVPAFAQYDFQRHHIANFDEGFSMVDIDFDKDGDIDLIAASRNDGLFWFENDGTASFSKHTIDNLFRDSWFVHAADLDNDGDIDVVSVAEEHKETAWFENSGDNLTFTEHLLDIESVPHSVFAADIDGDQDNDILVAVWEQGEILMWENDGSGNFTKVVIDGSFSFAHSVNAADLNNDGRLDIVAAGGSKTAWWRNNGGGSFTKLFLGTKGGFGVFPVDFNDDGLIDVIRTERSNFDLDWFENLDGSTFTRRDIKDSFGESWSADIGDFDLDGDNDVVAASYVPKDPNFLEDHISVLLNSNFSNYTEVIIEQLTIGDRPRVALVADFDNDGDDDIAGLLTRVDEIVWYETLGSPIVPETLTVTGPNGGETLEVGQNFLMAWQSTGDIPDVKIEYSPDNGGVWNEIIASTPNTGSYNWTVPNDPTDLALVRILDAIDGAPADTSDAVFSIVVSSLTVTSPNGGEIWNGESTQFITWNSTGLVDSVAVEYSLDNGLTWTSIIASTENTGSYSWTLPDVNSGEALVRISDSDDGIPSDTSDAVFSIVGSNLIVTAPNGGESWLLGTTQTIAWTTTGAVDSVDLEYSIDNGASWMTIVASLANTGSYSWTVPDANSGQALVRISDSDDGIPVDTSDEVFTIFSVSVTLTAPNGGESWLAGSSQTITWTTTGTVNLVTLEYSIDNGASWMTIMTNLANTGSYVWDLPNVESDSALVRISDAIDGNPTDVSDGVFAISMTTLTLTAPNGGETWVVSDTEAISWVTTGTVDSVMLEYSADNGASWVTIESTVLNTGATFWNIPDVSTSEALVRVSDAADGLPSDISDAVFTIAGAFLTLTSPNGGEEWDIATDREIAWDSGGPVDNVKLEYSLNNGTDWMTIIDTTPNAGAYNWNLPETPSDSALVRISDAADGLPVDVSDSLFVISNAALTLTSPNGGEIYSAGTNQTISWATIGSITSITLDYSVDNGANWTNIVTSTFNTGSHNWDIPEVNTGQALVRVADANDGTPFDMSDNTFSIAHASLSLTQPNGGETWMAPGNELITWHSTGFIDSVSLEYSLDNGTSWMSITPATFNDGIFSWAVPDTSSESALVRVSDVTNSELMDMSDTVFTLDKNTTSISIGDSDQIPDRFKLFQNYPNPFNPTTTIRFAVPQQSYVELRVYNYLGELVDVLVSDNFAAGEYSVEWRAGELASGTYIYRLQADGEGFVQTMKLTLVK